MRIGAASGRTVGATVAFLCAVGGAAFAEDLQSACEGVMRDEIPAEQFNAGREACVCLVDEVGEDKSLASELVKLTKMTINERRHHASDAANAAVSACFTT
ncbi:MAG: hypothetical protein AAGC95_16815 [Pseudomonadota bacterium]